MAEISGQYRQFKDLMLVNETPGGRIKTGKFKGVTSEGDIVVTTAPKHVEIWKKEDSRTLEQLVSEKNRKIFEDERKLAIVSAFASIQDKIIQRLSKKQAGECPECNCGTQSIDIRA